ncbi:metallophosphoesterase family protein [Peribacillus sp. NPDC094092]|uniref:metallophosphoesterase family protein n=1 Tax=Peribacillus sp. NPDC094092 TaxID=3390611 RepID=UPI003D065894
MEFNFLQISDIHFQIENFHSRRLRSNFINKLSELHREKKYDFVILTGDISHQGQEFTDSQQKFLMEVLTVLDLSIENLYLVPGNHDINRDKERSNLINMINESGDSSDTLDNYMEDTEKSSTLLKSFNSFQTFYNSLFNKNYPLENLHFIVEEQRCNLIFLNTCIIADKSGEEGTLLIGKQKLLDALEELNTGNGKLNIAMGHHSLECFKETEKHILDTLFDDYNIDIYFAGHVHKAGYHIEANQSRNMLNIICSGLHNDGYTVSGFVDVNVRNSNVAITQYVWNSQHAYWTVNNQLGRKMMDGVLKLPLSRFINKPNEQINDTRKLEVIKKIEILFNENERIFKQYGPYSITAQQSPHSELAHIWREYCINTLIPNNDKILELILENIDLIPLEKQPIVEEYKNHIEGFKMNHLSEYKNANVPTFPQQIKSVFH